MYEAVSWELPKDAYDVQPSNLACSVCILDSLKVADCRTTLLGQ